MRIAICDDEDQERLNIEALVKRYAPELSIVLFSSADELLAAAKTTFFPLIFLDIEMDDTNGFDAAEELMSGSAKPLIVFVTKSTEYTIRGYDVAFHYLVKPLNDAKFHEVLKRALRLIILHSPRTANCIVSLYKKFCISSLVIICFSFIHSSRFTKLA